MIDVAGDRRSAGLDTPCPPEIRRGQIEIGERNTIELAEAPSRQADSTNGGGVPTSTIDRRSGLRYRSATRWMSSTVTAFNAVAVRLRAPLRSMPKNR